MSDNKPIYTMSLSDLREHHASLVIAKKRYESQANGNPRNYDKEVYEFLNAQIRFTRERMKHLA